MVIIREKREPLVEMARIKGFGITIEVRSDDHGKFGNKESPAHAHILDGQGREIAQIAFVSKNQPKKPADIVWHRTPNPPQGLADKIIKLAASPSKAGKKGGFSVTVWQYAVSLWVAFHEG